MGKGNAVIAAQTRYGRDCYLCGAELLLKRRGKDQEWHIKKARELKVKLPTIDHVIPLSMGGPKRAWWNHRPCCQLCNRRKSSRPLWAVDRAAWDRFMKESGQYVRGYIRRHRELGSSWYPTDQEWWEWDWHGVTNEPE